VVVMAMTSIVKPVFQLYHQEIVPPERRSTMAGAATAAFSLSGAGVSLGGGYLIATFGYRNLFLTTGALSALGVALFWGTFRVPRGEFAAISVPTNALAPDDRVMTSS
jgi:predicted MFS family arabinose efflux permease